MIKTIDVILRVLAGEVDIYRIGDDALFAVRIVPYGGADFGAIFAAHDERAYAGGAVIEAESVLGHRLGFTAERTVAVLRC